MRSSGALTRGDEEPGSVSREIEPETEAVVMETSVQFPSIRRTEIVRTPQMIETERKILDIVPEGGLAVITGDKRRGKTVTSREIKRRVNASYRDDNPDAFRAVHFTVGRSASGTHRSSMKHGVASLFNAAIGALEFSVYAHTPVETLARGFVQEMSARNQRLVFVDEAGCLNLEEIRGMVLCRDTAEDLDIPIAIVFVGMDDLPKKLMELPQIEGRIHEWIYFAPFSFEETWDYLATLNPHFAALDPTNEEHNRQVRFVFERYGGTPGLMTPFLNRLRVRQAMTPVPFTLEMLEAVARDKTRDRDQALAECGNWSPGPARFNILRTQRKPSGVAPILPASQREDAGHKKPRGAR